MYSYLSDWFTKLYFILKVYVFIPLQVELIHIIEGHLSRVQVKLVLRFVKTVCRYHLPSMFWIVFKQIGNFNFYDI